MTTLSVGIDGLLDEYVSRVETLIDLVNIKPILEDEDDIQVPVYSDIAKAAVHLANMCRESKTQLAKSREHHKELQVCSNLAFNLENSNLKSINVKLKL